MPSFFELFAQDVVFTDLYSFFLSMAFGIIYVTWCRKSAGAQSHSANRYEHFVFGYSVPDDFRCCIDVEHVYVKRRYTKQSVCETKASCNLT